VPIINGRAFSARALRDACSRVTPIHVSMIVWSTLFRRAMSSGVSSLGKCVSRHSTRPTSWSSFRDLLKGPTDRLPALVSRLEAVAPATNSAEQEHDH
jgi:hypothetical protein